MTYTVHQFEIQPNHAITVEASFGEGEVQEYTIKPAELEDYIQHAYSFAGNYQDDDGESRAACVIARWINETGITEKENDIEIILTRKFVKAYNQCI